MKLQPLRIPVDWTITYNSFYDIQPTPDLVCAEISIFKQDLLQICHMGTNALIDLGWTPEGQFSDGAFQLQVLQTDFNGKLLFKLRSQDKNQIVEKIEQLCDQITSNKFDPLEI